MNITSELEKLVSLRDHGDLSQEEFEKAKALLLSEEKALATSTPRLTPNARAESDKKERTLFLLAVLTTLAAALSGVSAIIIPSLGSFGNLIFWVSLSFFWWILHFKMKTETK